jgi:hypothetical protein
MFKKWIFSVICTLEKTTQELKRAYKETYEEDKNLEQSFMQEVNKRKEANKRKLLQIMTAFVIEKTLQDDNFIMPFGQAKEIANGLFQVAKEQGNIDELNRYRMTE